MTSLWIEKNVNVSNYKSFALTGAQISAVKRQIPPTYGIYVYSESFDMHFKHLAWQTGHQKVKKVFQRNYMHRNTQNWKWLPCLEFLAQSTGEYRLVTLNKEGKLTTINMFQEYTWRTHNCATLSLMPSKLNSRFSSWSNWNLTEHNKRRKSGFINQHKFGTGRKWNKITIALKVPWEKKVRIEALKQGFGQGIPELKGSTTQRTSRRWKLSAPFWNYRKTKLWKDLRHFEDKNSTEDFEKLPSNYCAIQRHLLRLRMMSWNSCNFKFINPPQYYPPT